MKKRLIISMILLATTGLLLTGCATSGMFGPSANDATNELTSNLIDQANSSQS